MKYFSLIICSVILLFLGIGCGKRSELCGKLVNNKGKAIPYIIMIAKQVQLVKGYEEFETITNDDGEFIFKNLFPSSEYMIYP